MESNWCSCTKCHAGYGLDHNNFDFSDTERMDCLVCHDTTGTYSKKKNRCGYPNPDVDLLKVARNVGSPSRTNCGACHWYGGGGDNVKHGDLSSAMASPSREHDVHMGGLDFTCQKCHTTTEHRIAGVSTTTAVSEGEVSCTDCHAEKPHKPASGLQQQLNQHCDALSCQICHIPEFAEKVKTVTYWDWSESGKKDKLLEKSADKTRKLSKKKGLLVKESHVQPTYEWYNGKHRRYRKGDPVNMDGVTELNPPQGDINDPQARITPYKIMVGVEPVDAENGYMIVPKLHGEGYFKNYNWQRAAELGMKAAGLDFSGEITFAKTRMHWRINHGVAPQEDALSCLDCHGTDGVMDFKALGYEGDPAVVGGREASGE